MEKDLYGQLAERIGLGDSERIPKLFKMIADEDEARLLLAMPGTVEQLASSLGMEAERVKEMIELLYRKGLVFESVKPDGIHYRMCRNLIQFHDATILYRDATREFLDLWQEYMDVEWPRLAGVISKVMPRPTFRVIPVDTVISGGSRILDYEGARRIVETARNLAVTNCTCRLTAHRCDAPLEVCMQIDKAADYAVKRGTGRALSKEEALKMLEATEEAGLVHCTENKAGLGHVICNCCSCCCQILPIYIKEGKRVLDPSRYRAEVDPEACTGCEICIERCHFEAIRMEEAEDGGGKVSRVIGERCMGCGLCATSCPTDAISLHETRPQDFIPAEMPRPQA